MKCLLALVVTLVSVAPAYAEPTGGGGSTGGPGEVFLTAAQRRTRAELIRDTAAAAGMTNAALLAGIGEIETNFAHCWSEATWACQGPASASCGGGPVIAGASDGPCSAQQGGLGMFQFDSGTFSQTIATYGPSIVTMQGNVDAVIPFLVTRAIQSVDGVNTADEALAWMNSITIANGDPQYEAWLYFVAWRYNGCKGCTTQINKYRSGTNKLHDEFGAGFWTVAAGACDPVPAAGRTIDNTDGCFHKSGTPTSWYASDSGMGDGCFYTYTTDDPAADNHATWEMRFESAGRYRVEVYTDGMIGQTHQAKYVVSHAGGSTDVVINQAAAKGFRSLGEFDFTADQPFTVSLGDNTGEAYDPAAKIGIIFDAVRVVPGDGSGGSGGGGGGGGDDDAAGGDGGGCAAGGGGCGALVLGLLALAALCLPRGR